MTSFIKFNVNKYLNDKTYGQTLIDKAINSYSKHFRFAVVNEIDNEMFEFGKKDKTPIDLEDIIKLITKNMNICDESKTEQEETTLSNMIMFSTLLMDLKWTEHEKETLPEKYLKEMVHIALEKADDGKDDDHFVKILNGEGKLRKHLLLKHIEITKSVFKWNFQP